MFTSERKMDDFHQDFLIYVICLKTTREIIFFSLLKSFSLYCIRNCNGPLLHISEIK